MARTSLYLLLLATFTRAPWRCEAQTPPPAFVHGVDYSFERMSARRQVSDSADRGPITLISYVYRPLKNDRREVVLFSHGSTGGGQVSPREPLVPPRAVVRFFTSRGYTLVAPMRRGRGESSGTSLEECPFWAGSCTLAQHTALFSLGLHEALLDLSTVIDQVVYGHLVPRGSKILFCGVSRGGFISLKIAAERPDMAKGVVNFVGGWFSIRDQYPLELNRERLGLQTEQLGLVGAKARAPTLWIYADRDPNYTDSITREFFRSFQAAGGLGEYVFISSHPLESGHRIAEDTSLWDSAVDAFLKRLR